MGIKLTLSLNSLIKTMHFTVVKIFMIYGIIACDSPNNIDPPPADIGFVPNEIIETIPFEDLLEMSTKRALDVTYAKAPDVPLFKSTANFLSRTGLTAVTTPFPRFMFNSIELMGQYSGGAFNPAIKRALGKKNYKWFSKRR